MKNKNSTIVALVPMRHDSERVKQKNYRDFNGKPLFCWIIETLLACPSISSVYINTDSPVIKEKAPLISERVKIIDRPDELSGGDVPMNDILMYDVEHIEADYYLQTHTTNPVLSKETVEKAIAAFLNDERCDSLFGVTKMQTRFWDQQTQPINHDPNVLARTQDLPPIYEENSNIYIFSKDTLQRRKNRIGFNPMMFEIDKIEAVDIDDEQDFKLAEMIHQQKYGEGALK